MARPGFKMAVHLGACDGGQDIVVEGLDKSQIDLLRKLAKAADIHGGGCTPTLTVFESPEEAAEEFVAWGPRQREDWMTDEDYADALEWDETVVIEL